MNLGQFKFEPCLEVGFADKAVEPCGKNQKVTIFRKITRWEKENREVDGKVKLVTVPKYLHKVVKTVNKIDVYNVQFVDNHSLLQALKNIGKRK